MGSQHLPWLDRRGNILSNEELKKISKNWDETTWEAYLRHEEVPCSESSISPNRYDHLIENMTSSIFEYSQNLSDNEKSTRTKVFLNRLTRNQRQIIELIFWKNLSEREIAKSLNISPNAVHKSKLRALKALSKHLEGVGTSPIMRGKENFLQPPGSENVLDMVELAASENHQHDEVRRQL